VVKHRAVVYSCLVKNNCEDRVGVVVRVDANKAELLEPGLYFDQALGMCLAVHDEVLLILLFVYLWDRDCLIEQVELVAQELQVLHLCLDNLGLEFVIADKPKDPVKSSWFPVALHFTNIDPNEHVHMLVGLWLSLNLLNLNTKTLVRPNYKWVTSRGLDDSLPLAELLLQVYWA